MNKIIVVGTFHTEGGACTSNELLKAIERLSPSVIFFEASPEDFPAMLKATKSFNTPEIDAIRVILEKKSMDVIPVDLIDEDPLDRRQDSMFELFREKYREYYCASEIHVREIYEKGFPYLNSNDSDQIFRDMDSMRRIFVSYANHFQLSKTHKDWLDLNDKRENHWINAIHDYFERNKISSAVFLVGSAHRIRLMDKVKNLQANIPSWDFYPFKT